MEIRIVDLYEHFGVKKTENAQCSLTCYIARTSLKVSACRKKPAVLILPGGGYGHVSPREGEPIAMRFLTAGYAAFVLEYSCAPCAFPVPLREAAMAMRYIRENAAEFEVNTKMVAAMGFSAGGHLCGMLGTMFDCPEVADIAPAEQLRPDALGLCYPVAVSWGNTHEGSFRNLCGEDLQLRDRLSLDKRVRPDMMPVFLWHTRDDGAVPCRNSILLAAALEASGVDFAFHLYRHGVHGLSTADVMAYPAFGIPDTSRSVPGWIDEMQEFWQEIGFQITDLEEEA